MTPIHVLEKILGEGYRCVLEQGMAIGSNGESKPTFFASIVFVRRDHTPHTLEVGHGGTLVGAIDDVVTSFEEGRKVESTED